MDLGPPDADQTPRGTRTALWFVRCVGRAARGRGRRVLHCGRGRAREQQQRGRAHVCAVEHAGESAEGKGGGSTYRPQ